MTDPQRIDVLENVLFHLISYLAHSPGVLQKADVASLIRKLERSRQPDEKRLLRQQD